jgi:aryl-alcohol dehydrogenase-like predicted oxidoreductase
MKQRTIGSSEVGEVGFGCMNLNHAYGLPLPRPEAIALVRRAFALGVTHFDTAALYGSGVNEEVVGEALRPFRDQVFLASKCGITAFGGPRIIDGRPDTLRETCRGALRRLGTNVIDLYYLHRWDKTVPIEDSVGALSDLVKAGDIRMIGLSEVSAATLRAAHVIHPIAAVQNEYSLWSRNPEIAMLDACLSLGVTLVAFSPLGRGFLADAVRDAENLEPKDIRRSMPRFQGESLRSNLELLPEFRALAARANCTPAQLALAWLLKKDPRVLPIPGTSSPSHLEENVGAASVQLSDDLFAAAGALINTRTIHGARYPAAALAEVDSEEFAA